MKKTKAKLPFGASARKGLAADLEEKDYDTVVETAIERLQAGLHLELS